MELNRRGFLALISSSAVVASIPAIAYADETNVRVRAADLGECHIAMASKPLSSDKFMVNNLEDILAYVKQQRNCGQLKYYGILQGNLGEPVKLELDGKDFCNEGESVVLYHWSKNTTQVGIPIVLTPDRTLKFSFNLKA